VLPAVDGGERAVVFDRFRGVLAETSGEGTHLRVPWVQVPHIMDIRTRPKVISSVTGTKGKFPLLSVCKRRCGPKRLELFRVSAHQVASRACQVPDTHG